MNGRDLPPFHTVLKNSIVGRKKANSGKKKEDYDTVKKRVMSSPNPSNDDYDKLSFDDKDEWADKYHPDLGF